MNDGFGLIVKDLSPYQHPGVLCTVLYCVVRAVLCCTVYWDVL
jgi:hypothetical protein